MIEIICGEEDEKKDMPFRELPKNVRQIGDTKEKKKIYIEDFVVTYLNRLAKPEQAYARGAILLGDIFQTQEGIAVFISGALEAQNLELDMDETIFDDDIWRKLLRERDEYFPGQAVVGWFLSRIGFSVEMNQKIINAHLNYFPGNHRVLYMMDSLENEDAFYMCENQQMLRQKGYYIYYEKNAAMQEYMILKNRETPRREERDARQEQIRRDKKVVHNYRKLARYRKQDKKQKLQIRLTRAASMGLIIAALGYALYEMGGGLEMGSGLENPMEETMAELGAFVKGEEADTAVTTAVEAALRDTAGKTEEKTGETENSQDGDNIETEKQDGAKTKDSGKEKEEEGKNGGQGEEDYEGDHGDDAIKTQGKPLYYTVQKGDTLAAISRRMYTTARYASQIARANNLENEDEIYIGQKIVIPALE